MAIETPRVLLAVTGGIAAYKAADLCSKLVNAGTEVRVAFSRGADRFVAPLTFEALSGHSVYESVLDTPVSYQMEHIGWARWADKLVVAPATADIIAKLANGLADDPVTTLYLAFTGEVYLAPSMNTTMLEHPATQANLKLLADRGVRVVSPGIGSLACGEIGSGRMAEPHEIMAAIGVEQVGNAGPHPTAVAPLSRAADNSLTGKTLLITSGPTREYLDPVRFISSPSSGRMGYAVAREALRRGAKVLFVTGPVEAALIPAGNVEVHRVQSAREMHQKVLELKGGTDIFVFVAAVGDFRPANPIGQKIKRTGNSITLPLVENPDIAQAIGREKTPGQITVGFAAETDDIENNALAKLQRKNLDFVILNDVSNAEIGFNSDENEVQIIDAKGERRHVPKTSKENVAYEILSAVAKSF